MPGKIVIDNKSIEPIYGTIKSKVGESNTASFQKFYDEYNRGDAEAKQWFYDAVNYYTDFNKDKKYATPDDLYASFYVNPEDKVNYYKTKMEVREAEIKQGSNFVNKLYQASQWMTDPYGSVTGQNKGANPLKADPLYSNYKANYERYTAQIRTDKLNIETEKAKASTSKALAEYDANIKKMSDPMGAGVNNITGPKLQSKFKLIEETVNKAPDVSDEYKEEVIKRLQDEEIAKVAEKIMQTDFARTDDVTTFNNINRLQDIQNKWAEDIKTSTKGIEGIYKELKYYEAQFETDEYKSLDDTKRKAIYDEYTQKYNEYQQLANNIQSDQIYKIIEPDMIESVKNLLAGEAFAALPLEEQNNKVLAIREVLKKKYGQTDPNKAVRIEQEIDYLINESTLLKKDGDKVTLTLRALKLDALEKKKKLDVVDRIYGAILHNPAFGPSRDPMQKRIMELVHGTDKPQTYGEVTEYTRDNDLMKTKRDLSGDRFDAATAFKYYDEILNIDNTNPGNFLEKIARGERNVDWMNQGTLGIKEMAETFSVLDAALSNKNGKYLSLGMQSVLDSKILLDEAMAMDTQSKWEKAGAVLGNIPSFMGQMILTAGAYKAVKAPIMSAMTKKIEKETTKQAIKKLYNFGIESMASGVAAAVQAPLQVPMFATNVMMHMTPQGYMAVGDNGLQVKINPYSGKTFAEALGSGYKDTYIEVLSEHFGKVIGYIIPSSAPKAMKALLGGKVNQRAANILPSRFTRLAEGMTDNMAWNGAIGEFSEEMFGSALRYATAESDDERLNALIEFSEWQTTFIATALAAVPLGGISMTASALKPSGIQYNLGTNKDGKESILRFTPKEYEDIQAMRDNKTGIINADKYNEYVKNQLKNKSLTPENLMKYNKFLIYDTHDKVMTPALHKSYVDKYSGSSAEELKVAMKEIDTELQERQKNNDKSLEFIQRGYEYDFITREYDTRIKQQNGERINKLRAEGGIINVINHLIDQYNNTSENEKVLKSQLETKINELKEEALKQYNVPSSKVKAPNPLNFNQVRALQDNDQILIRYQIGTNSDQEKSDGFVNISGRVTMATFNRENNNGVISLVTESGDVINLDIDKIAKDQKNDMQVYPFVPDMAKGEKALQEELDERINQLKQKELKFDDEKEIDEKKKEEEKKEKKSPVVPVQEDNQDSADTDSYDPSDMEDQELNDQFAEESFTEEQVNASTEETVETETTEQAPVEQQEEPQAPISKTEKKLSDKKIIVGQNSIAPEEKKLEEKDNKAKNRGPINNTRGRKVAKAKLDPKFKGKVIYASPKAGKSYAVEMFDENVIDGDNIAFDAVVLALNEAKKMGMENTQQYQQAKAAHENYQLNRTNPKLNELQKKDLLRNYLYEIAKNIGDIYRSNYIDLINQHLEQGHTVITAATGVIKQALDKKKIDKDKIAVFVLPEETMKERGYTESTPGQKTYKVIEGKFLDTIAENNIPITKMKPNEFIIDLLIEGPKVKKNNENVEQKRNVAGKEKPVVEKKKKQKKTPVAKSSKDVEKAIKNFASFEVETSDGTIGVSSNNNYDEKTGMLTVYNETENDENKVHVNDINAVYSMGEVLAEKKELDPNKNNTNTGGNAVAEERNENAKKGANKEQNQNAEKGINEENAFDANIVNSDNFYSQFYDYFKQETESKKISKEEFKELFRIARKFSEQGKITKEENEFADKYPDLFKSLLDKLEEIQVFKADINFKNNVEEDKKNNRAKVKQELPTIELFSNENSDIPTSENIKMLTEYGKTDSIGSPEKQEIWSDQMAGLDNDIREEFTEEVTLDELKEMIKNDSFKKSKDGKANKVFIIKNTVYEYNTEKKAFYQVTNLPKLKFNNELKVDQIKENTLIQYDVNGIYKKREEASVYRHAIYHLQSVDQNKANELADNRAFTYYTESEKFNQRGKTIYVTGSKQEQVAIVRKAMESFRAVFDIEDMSIEDAAMFALLSGSKIIPSEIEKLYESKSEIKEMSYIVDKDGYTIEDLAQFLAENDKVNAKTGNRDDIKYVDAIQHAIQNFRGFVNSSVELMNKYNQSSGVYYKTNTAYQMVEENELNNAVFDVELENKIAKVLKEMFPNVQVDYQNTPESVMGFVQTGQTKFDALRILLSEKRKQDTLPHEYAHIYIAWFRDTELVQAAIKKFGSEEALVQSIGEQIVSQKGEAMNFWNTFVDWILNQFGKLDLVKKEQFSKILADAVLTNRNIRKIEVINEPSQTQPAVKETQTEEQQTTTNEIISSERLEQIQQLFDTNPELANIGTREQYYRYLDAIFPDSKVKDIVYHGSLSRFIRFKYGTQGIHFTSNINTANKFAEAPPIEMQQFISESKNIPFKAAEPTIYPVLLNIKDIKEVADETSFTDSGKYTQEEIKQQSDRYKAKYGVDGLKYINNVEGDKADTYIVFEPEQIHILGSKQDIEGFKNFVNNKKSVQIEQLEEQYINQVQTQKDSITDLGKLIDSTSNKTTMEYKASMIGLISEVAIENTDITINSDRAAKALLTRAETEISEILTSEQFEEVSKFLENNDNRYHTENAIDAKLDDQGFFETNEELFGSSTEKKVEAITRVYRQMMDSISEQMIENNTSMNRNQVEKKIWKLFQAEGLLKNIKTTADFEKFITTKQDDPFNEQVRRYFIMNKWFMPDFVSLKMSYGSLDLVPRRNIIITSSVDYNGNERREIKALYNNVDDNYDIMLDTFFKHMNNVKLGDIEKALKDHENFIAEITRANFEDERKTWNAFYKAHVKLIMDLTGLDQETVKAYFTYKTKESEVFLKTVKNINGNKTNSIIKFTFDSWEDLLNLDIKGFNNNNNLKYGVLKMNRMLEEGESIESIVPYYFHKAKGTHQQKTLPGILVSLLMSNNVISNLYKGITKYSENEVKEAIIDYFTKGKNEVYNNLKQMASGTIDRVTDISLSSSDVENKRFPSFVPKSHLSDAVKEIQEMPGENDFKAYWKSRGRSPLFAISVGMKNRTKEDGGKRLKGYTSRDLVLQMLAEYTNSGRTYYQIVQQFGDKDDIFLIESPKYQPTSSDIEELRNEYGEYDSLIKWIKDYITPGTENYISDLLSNTESANIEKFANEFAYNYIKNNKEIVSLFIGDIVEDHDGSTSDLVKRMAQVSSSGMRFDTDIEGGIGKTTRAIVFNDHENMESILSEFKKDETFDGVLFFIDDYGQKLAVSAGDKIAHPDKFGKSFYSVKNVFSWKTKKGRSLWKQNWVNIDLLVDTHGKNSIYYHMREFMLKNRLDIVGFNSGVKKNDNKVKDHPLSGDKGSFKFFNGEEINQAAYEAKSEEVEEFVSNLDNTKITYLQDLRHDIKPKMAKNPIQTVLSTLQFENEVKELIDITNKAKRLKIARVTKEFDALKTDADIRKYVEKAFKKDANSELSNLLNTPGMKLTEPLIRRSIRSTLLNNVKRATEFNIPRVTSQELPATVQSLDSTEYQGGLKSYDIVEWTPEVSTMVVEEKGATIKDVKLKTMNVTKLARIDVNIRGVRSSKYVDSYEEAIETIKKDPILYNDLYWIGNDELKGAILTYEITPVYDRKGNISKWEIPGEYVKAERVPNTNPHSITLARVRKNHARGNFISFNKDLQKRRGSDFDGDQNFVQVLAIDNNGIIWDETEKGLANQLLFGLFKIYSNSANLPTILREIDVDKYEEYIMPPVNSTKLPSDIDTVKAIKDRKFVDNLTKYPNLKEGDLVEIGETGTYAKANFIESDKVKFSYIGKKSSYIKAKDKYEFFDPRGYVEQVEKNMAGTKMKAIFTNLAASFSIGSYYGWKLKKTIKIKDLEFSEFIKDKQGLIRAHIVNFINLAFDGGNKPILPEMRINPSNINLFVFMLSTNKAVDSMNEEQINEYVGRIINFIKKSPILAEYNRLKNIHDSEDKEKINFEIQERISKQFENGRLIMDMIKMSKDLGSVKNLYDLATGSVDSYEDYIRAKLLWERAKNNNLAIINTRGIEKTDLFKSIPETIYTYDKVFENNTFEGTEFGKELTRELLVENAQYADKDSIRQYNAMLHNTIAVNAIDPTSEINGPEEASDKVENLKKQYDLIVEQNKKLQNAGLPNGMAFLRLLSFELDRNVTVKQEDEYGKVKDVKKRLMTVRVQKEFSSFESVNKSMDEIQEAFNFLWTNPITTNVLKKIVYFNAVDKGLSSSVANGSLYPLTSTDFKNDLSNKINYELEQWKADVLTNEERAKFRKSLQDNFPYSYVDYNKRAIPVPKRMLTRAEEASKSIYYNENEKSPTTGARVSVDGENAILLKKEGETTTALDKRQQVIVLEKEYDVIGNYLTVPIGNNDYIVISPNIIIDATTGKNLYNDLSDVNIQLINTIMTNMPKAKQHTDKTMPLAAANPVLREFIRKRLNKMFPNVKRFQSWEEFEKFVNSKGGSAAMRSIGAAFADAVFVDEESARQDTELHEHGHIYYDSMEDNHPIKQALREMFYVEGMSIEDIDERVVVAIGQRGLSYAEAQMSMSQYGKFMQAMKYFWKWVKRMFGMQNTWANPLDYIVDQMWNHRQAFGLTPIYNNIVKYQTVPPVTNPADSIMSDDEKFAVNPTRTSTIDGEDKRFIEVNGKIINSPTSILNILSRNGANMEMIAYRKAYKNVSLRIEADKSLLPTEGAEEKKRQMIQQEQQRLLAQWDDAPLIGVLLHKIVELTNKGITDIKKIKEELAKEKRDGIENHIDIPEDVIENMVNKFSSFFEKLKKEGYTIYTELTVTNAEKLFKGVIDIIAINHKTKKIKIYDLKTSNYWADESNEQYVDEFDTYSSEVRALRNDKITRRALQLNMYAWAMKNMSMEDKKAFAQQINTSDDVLTNDKEGYAVEEISILETKYSYEQSNSQVTAINSIKQQDYKETSQRNNVEAHALAMINSVMVRNEAISIKNMTLAEAKKAGKDWKDQDGKKHRGDTKYYEIIKEQHDAESKLTVLFGNLENISANNIGNIFSYDFMRAIFKYIESEDKAIDYDMKIEDFLQIIDGPEFLAILTKDKFKEEMSKNKSIEQEYSKDIASFKAKNSSYTDLDIMYNQYLVYKKRFDKMLTEIGTLRTLKDYADEPINKNSINAEINYKLAQFQKLMMNIPPHISGSLGNWLNDFMNTAIMIREIRTENKDKQGYKPFTILLYKMINDPTSAYSDMKSYIMRGKEGSEMMRSSLRTTGAVAAFEILAFHEEGKMNRVIKGYEQEMKYARRHLTEDDMQKMVKYVDIKHGHVFVTPSEAKAIFEKLYNERLAYGKTESYKRLYERVIQSYNHRFNNAIKTGAQKGNYKYIRGYIDLNEIKGFLKSKGISVSDSKTSQLHNALKPSNNDDIIINITNPHSKILNFKWYKGYVKDPSLSDTMTLSELKHLIAITFDNMQSLNIPIEDRNEFVNNVIQFMNEKNKELKREKVKLDNKAIYVPSPSFSHMEVSIPTKKVFNSLFSHITKSAKSDYSSTLFPVFNYISNKYNKSAVNANQYLNLRKFDLYAVDKGLINEKWFKRLFIFPSLVYLGSSLKRATLNRLQGMATNFIVNLKYWRPFANINKFSKIARKENIGVQTLDIMGFNDSESKVMKFFEKGAFILNEKVDYWNIAEILAGAMTKDEASAYDSNGDIIPEKAHLAPTRDRWAYFRTVIASQGYYNTHKAMYKNDPVFSWAGTMVFSWSVPMVERVLGKYTVDIAGSRKAGVINTIGTWARIKMFNMFMSESKKIDTYDKIISNVLGNTAYKTKRDAVMALKQRYRLKNIAFGVDYDSSIVMKNGKYYIPDFNKIDKEFDKLLLETMGYVYDPSKKIESSEIISKNFNVLYNTMIFVSFCKILAVYLMANGDDDDKYGEDRYVTWKDVFSLNKVKKYKSSFSRPMNMNESQYRMYYAKEYAIETLIKITNDATTGGFTALASRTMDPFSAPAGIIKSATSLLTSLLTGGDTVETVSGDKYYGSNELIYKFLGIFAGYGNYAEDMIGLHRWFSAAGIKEDELKFMDQKRKEYVNTLNKAKWYGYDTGNMKESERIDLYKIINAQSESSVKSMGDQVLLNYLRANQGLIDNEMYVDIKGKDNDYERTKDLVEK